MEYESRLLFVCANKLKDTFLAQQEQMWANVSDGHYCEAQNQTLPPLKLVSITRN